MIHGVGIDLACIPRFRRILSQFGDRFLQRAFHPHEIQHFHGLQTERLRLQFVASRWALKEATVKAFGARLLFPELVLTRPKRGAADPRPQLRTEGRAAEMFQERGICGTHVSLSHDTDYATAYVVLETECKRCPG